MSFSRDPTTLMQCPLNSLIADRHPASPCETHSLTPSSPPLDGSTPVHLTALLKPSQFALPQPCALTKQQSFLIQTST